MRCAEKTFIIHEVFYGDKFTLEGNDIYVKNNHRDRWIFYPQFVELANKEERYNNLIPDLLGDTIYRGL